jgi:anti-sigma regulatory factor (Ser/Thr protein kinase)
MSEKSLTVPGTLDSLKAIAAYVMKAAAEAGLDKKVTYRLRLAVDEIATNIITHGYDEAGLEGEIVVQTDLDDETLTIYLDDTGAAYNPQLNEAPDDLNLPLEERQIGGLGLYLTTRNVDKFFYKRIGNQNRHTFVVNRPSAQAGE